MPKEETLQTQPERKPAVYPESDERRGNALIRSAIRSRRVLWFYYKGSPRIVEPFCYGLEKGGGEVLRAYQTGGDSESGYLRGWKLFHLCEMSNLTVTSQSFDGSRCGFNPNDPAMKTIYCCNSSS